MIDLTQPPPRRWIEEHVKGAQPGMSDEELARHILSDQKYFMAGTENFPTQEDPDNRRPNDSLRYATGGWACCVMNLEEDAADLMSVIRRMTSIMLESGQTNTVPPASFLVYTYICLRHGLAVHARNGLELLKMHVRLRRSDHEDIQMLEAKLAEAAA